MDPAPPDPPAPAPPGQWIIESIQSARDSYVGSTVTWNVSLAAPPPAFAEAAFTVPYPPNPDFGGRDAALRDLAAALAAAPVAVVVGTGGQGKTQLAVEYAHRARAAGPYPGGIFWLSLADPTGVAAQVAELAGPKGLNEPGAGSLPFVDRVAAVRRRWQEPAARLLIFDNCADPAVFDTWCPPVGGCRVLVTSLRHGWRRPPRRRQLLLAPLARAAAVAILLGPRARAGGETMDDGRRTMDRPSAAGGQTSGLDGDQAAADAICAALGDLPLALAVAGAYLAAVPAARLDRYAARLHAAAVPDPALLAALDEPLPTGHEPSVVATFALSYDRLDPAQPGDARARGLLQRVAQAAPEPLPARLLQRLAEQDPDAADAAEETALAVNRLTGLGLIEPLPEGAARLHRLLAAYARSRAPAPAADQAALDAALSAELYAICHAGYPQAGTPYLPHARVAAPRAQERADGAAATLLNNVGALLKEQGDLPAARPLLARALAITEQILGPRHPDLVPGLNNLGSLLRAGGDYGAARPLLARALAIGEQALGPRHPDLVPSLNNLARLLQDAGDYGAARPLYERALAITEQAVGPIHPDTARSLNNLAGLLQTQGNLAAARPLYVRALAIREQTLGPRHPETAQSLNNLGTLYFDQGNLRAARPLYERALPIDEAAYGAHHPEVAADLNNLAALLQAEGDLPAARPLYERALAIHEQALGATHPSTAQSLYNLAGLLQAQGDGRGARALYARALAINLAGLGPAHPNTRRVRATLAALDAALVESRG